ncbi:hypothetical protein Q8W15_00170 [Photobacterium damselae subsp. piscicida]|nr:hypothetical protein [Photobacterium damselae subsp. piscicida]MDP2556220.1 hypothetical protein [Photobacterium damselae subsp. piscicida]MDP2568252.1 hypothetical protein [Photobacterium damselae subsp. piscicida]
MASDCLWTQTQYCPRGPALYHDKKRERPRIGGRIAPAGFHLEQLLLLLRQRLLVWLLLLSITLIIFHLGG